MRPDEPRKGAPDPQLAEAEFKRRFLAQFPDPAFAALGAELAKIADAAWDAYKDARKAPLTRKAGPDFEDPNYDLSVDWLAARDALRDAQARHADVAGPARILIISGSSRSDHTCPGEVSKSYRLAQLARETLAQTADVRIETLDLHHLTDEYGRRIHPCKSCFSTAPALCHWPCSCYPNYAMGQTQDWMNEIYPKWVEAHGVLIVTPVNWYHTSSALKLMIDRLVCAAGGNPDPTRTHGKDAKRAKQLEKDWDYPMHLQGRLFGLIVHGDVQGAGGVRRALHDWLVYTGLESAGAMAELDRYIGYWKPYATSHEELDRDEAIQEETRNVARALLQAVQAKRAGKWVSAGEGLEPPRAK